MKKQMQIEGFTFRYPDGNLDYRIVRDVEMAQDNAAGAAETPDRGIIVPRDWDLAFEQGFRIVPVVMTAGPSRGSWKKYAGK